MQILVALGLAALCSACAQNPPTTNLSAAEQRAADCLQGYGIHLYKNAGGQLRVRGDVNRMEEATLRGPCGPPVVTKTMDDEFRETFRQLDRMIVACLQGKGYQASYDRGIEIAKDVPPKDVDDCFDAAYASLQDVKE